MTSRARRRITAALAGLVAMAGGPSASLAQTCPDAHRLTAGFHGPMAHVRFLSDDRLEGRGVATRGERCAADYLAERFTDIGLEPAGHDGTYFHGFPVRTGSEFGPDNALMSAGEALTLHEDWAPHGFSASDGIDAELVYGGYGVSRPSRPDDPFPSDVRGRLLVVETGDPDSPGGRSVRADPYLKATIAARRGAAGLLILLPDGPLPAIDVERRESLPIPVVAVRGAAADRIRVAARAGAGARVRTDVRKVETAARNVVARLPGADPDLSAEYLIVGAHYDHLGLSEGEVYNGADDNASGTAALVEIARAVAEGPPPDRSILFIAFTGEEQGLSGSARFADDPTVPLDGAVAMLNLDMVGRLGGGPLTVFGVGTATEWGSLLDAANGSLARPLEITPVAAGNGPSDHATFHARGIPVLHLFTDTHAEYHRPGDDWEKIDAGGLDRVIGLATAIVPRIAAAGTTLTPP